MSENPSNTDSACKDAAEQDIDSTIGSSAPADAADDAGMPSDVNAELAHVNEMMELLALNRVWFPGYTPMGEKMLKGGIITAIFAFSCIIILGVCSRLWAASEPWLAPVALILVIAMVAGIIAAIWALLSHNKVPQPAFVLDADGSLWCVIPEDDAIYEPPFSKREIITLREQLGGYAKNLNNYEVGFALSYIQAIRKLQQTGTIDDFDISLIEDIDGYGDEGESKGAVADSRPDIISFVFTDRVTGEAQQIDIERQLWKDFTSWLDQEFEYSEDE